MEKQVKAKHIYLAYIACGLMILGVNLPQYIANTTGTKLVAVSRLDNEGILLLISAIIVIMFRYCKRKKYILAPLIVQIAIIGYYVVLFYIDKQFEMIHIGFVLQVAAVIFLIISMFVNINVQEEHINDFSTLKLITTEENDYTDKFIVRDIGWIVTTLVITIFMIVIKVQIHNYSQGVVTSSIAELKSSAKYMEQTKEYEYENDEYAIGIKDGYITSENGKEIVYVEINAMNKKDEKLIFHNIFDLRSSQRNIDLIKYISGEISASDVNNIYVELEKNVPVKLYAAFEIKDSNEDIRIFIKDRVNGNADIIRGKVIKMDKLHYIDSIEELLSIDAKIMKKTQGKDSKTPSITKDKIDLESKEDSKSDKEDTTEELDKKEESKKDELENGKEQDTSKKETSKEDKKDNTDKEDGEVKKDSTSDKTSSKDKEDTTDKSDSKEKEDKIDKESDDESDENETEEKEMVTGVIKFTKPTVWNGEDSTYVCLYNNEKDTEEYSRIEMSEFGNNVYSYLVNVEKDKKIYIAFTDGEDYYPKNCKWELSLGKIYISK
ncbi:MAG: hypothetical protein E7262_06605 [Lachnospiraceae bacterium]|nr:hypothetical protein [Lachnospiraceae bacterium]